MLAEHRAGAALGDFHRRADMIDAMPTAGGA